MIPKSNPKTYAFHAFVAGVRHGIEVQSVNKIADLLGIPRKGSARGE